MLFRPPNNSKHQEFIEKAIKNSAAENIDDEALEWIITLTSGEATQRKIRACKRWREKSSKHEYAFQQARQLWLSLGQSQELTDALLEPTPIEVKAYPISPFSTVGMPWIQSWLKSHKTLFASLVMAVMLGTTALYQYKNNYDFQTEAGQIQEYHLKDGSDLFLNTNSAVNSNFSNILRELSLEKGEIFVHVSNRTDAPFIVRTGDNIIKSLGTAFSVKKTSEDVIITVSDGVVNLSQPHQRAKQILKNQQAVITDDEVKISAINPINKLSWKDGFLSFENNSFHEIINTVRDYDQRKWVVYMDNNTRNMMLNTTVNIKDIDAWINGISKIVPIKVKQIGSVMVIYTT